MKCPYCNSKETKVVDKRDNVHDSTTRRRRECLKCAKRFTTYERIEKPQLVIVKNNGTRQLYSREKLIGGLYRACEKTTVTAMQIDKIVSNVEKKLYSCGETEIPTNKVGELIMNELANVNEVAYVRFASVYRRFKDIASFERELSEIKSHLKIHK